MIVYVDYREINYPDKKKDKLLTEILEVIHTLEGLPECNTYRCKLHRQKQHTRTKPILLLGEISLNHYVSFQKENLLATNLTQEN